jgi:hypothetical protein
MSRVNRALRAGLFTAVLTSSLGFGAAQAFAEPSERESGARARACDLTSCNNYCERLFGPGSLGYCERGGFCTCN